VPIPSLNGPVALHLPYPGEHLNFAVESRGRK
jgi:hypothetical protein